MDRHELRKKYQLDLYQEVYKMKKSYFQSGNLSFSEKLLSLDFQLIFLILTLGIISFFAMYSTERGVFGYYTQSHIYRFFFFFVVFFVISNDFE